MTRKALRDNVLIYIDDATFSRKCQVVEPVLLYIQS